MKEISSRCGNPVRILLPLGFTKLEVNGLRMISGTFSRAFVFVYPHNLTFEKNIECRVLLVDRFRRCKFITTHQ